MADAVPSESHLSPPNLSSQLQDVAERHGWKAKTEYCIGLPDVLDAVGRIRGYAHVTPVLSSLTMARWAGRDSVLFKVEAHQKTGSFKFRGAMNAVSMLSSQDKAKGVVTHSSGNHAQALALAAGSIGVKAEIVMPTTAPRSKVAAVRGYGARIIEVAPEARASTAAEVAATTGATFVHPSNDPRVMAGQGTMGVELLEFLAAAQSHAQGRKTASHTAAADAAVGGASSAPRGDAPLVDAVIVPVGGGGMISGVATAIKGIDSRIKVFGAEPEEADDAWRSLREGSIQGHDSTPGTVADGLRTVLGSNNFPIIQAKVDGIVRVSEDDIKRGTRVVWERLKVVVEPSAGVGVAALFSDEFRRIAPGSDCPRVAIVLCGGNLDIGSPLPFEGVSRWEFEG
jgi:threonine dehydratase